MFSAVASRNAGGGASASADQASAAWATGAGPAPYARGNGTSRLECDYVVAYGDTTSGVLDYLGADALTSGGD